MEILLPALQELAKLVVSAAVGAFTLNLAKRAKRRQEAPVQMSEYVDRQIQRVIEIKDRDYARREAERDRQEAEQDAEIAGLREELKAYREELRRRDQFEAEQAKQISELIRRLKNGNGGHTPAT